MRLICQFNYDEDLLQIVPKEQISVKALEFVDDKELGWYWKAINQIYPLIDQVKERFPDHAERWPTVFTNFDEVKKTFYSNTEVFIQEYKSLLPELTDENIVFSHNDV